MSQPNVSTKTWGYQRERHIPCSEYLQSSGAYGLAIQTEGQIWKTLSVVYQTVLGLKWEENTLYDEVVGVEGIKEDCL